MTAAGPFAEGDLALLVDSRGREYLLTLGTGQVYHSHFGAIAHDDILGRDQGARVKSAKGRAVIAIKPTLTDYVMNMPRHSQIIYPKDAAAILFYGDIYPGSTVLEAGMGSAGLTLALLRAVGPEGKVISYETREDPLKGGVRNVARYLGETPNHILRERDVYEGIDEDEPIDRIILDVPEPWRVLESAGEKLRPGGILIVYLPTVLQVHRVHMDLDAHPAFEMAETFEIMQRPWHFAGSSARPDHRMVAHTGFITRTVLCEPRPKRRPQNEDPADVDEATDDDGEAERIDDE